MTKSSAKITIEESYCKGCGICVDFCPKKIFGESKKLSKSGASIPGIQNEGACIECGICEMLCPDLAISVVRTKKGAKKEDETGE